MVSRMDAVVHKGLVARHVDALAALDVAKAVAWPREEGGGHGQFWPWGKGGELAVRLVLRPALPLFQRKFVRHLLAVFLPPHLARLPGVFKAGPLVASQVGAVSPLRMCIGEKATRLGGSWPGSWSRRP